MKKIISVLLVTAMFLSATACGKKDSKKAEIALITDIGTIDDKSFNQGTWEGIKAYAKKADKSYKYFKPIEDSDEARINAIDLAIKGGAKTVVCPGYLFEVPIHTAQAKYPDVHFVLIDGVPHKLKETKADIGSKTYSILFAEEQSGFLAGYAAVKEGYKKLGFMGGVAVPAVVRYGYGYIQGADYAAKELGLAKGDISIKYTYVGNFNATPENMALASSWYNAGADIIFACGGAVGNSVMKAAETANKKVIGVDVDQCSESNTVMTSAMKNLQKSVGDVLASIDGKDNETKAGQTVTLGADTGNVLLPMQSSKFTKFTQKDYDAIYKQIVDGKIKIGKDTIADKADKVSTEIVKVELAG